MSQNQVSMPQLGIKLFFSVWVGDGGGERSEIRSDIVRHKKELICDFHMILMIT